MNKLRWVVIAAILVSPLSYADMVYLYRWNGDMTERYQLGHGYRLVRKWDGTREECDIESKKLDSPEQPYICTIIRLYESTD